MWDFKADWHFVTTNGYVRKNGTLVMGRGAALEATKKFPGIDLWYGNKVKQYEGNPYYILFGYANKNYSIGLFQVKYRWSDKASIDLIDESSKRLAKLAKKYIDQTFALNFPGIGNGQLAREDVLSFILNLPNNVHVFERDN